MAVELRKGLDVRAEAFTMLHNVTEHDSSEGDFREFWRHFMYNAIALTVALVMQCILLRAEFSKPQGPLWPLRNSVRCLSNTTFLNYMVFMKICRNMFATLTIVASLVMLWTGNFSLLYVGFVGGATSVASVVRKARLESESGDVPLGTVCILYATSFIYGIVVLIYAQLMQSTWHQTPLYEASNKRMVRTVWLSWLPVRDQMRGAPFLLGEREFQRVASDLRLALLTTLATSEELQDLEMLTRQELEEAAQRLVENVEVTPVVDRWHYLSFLVRDSVERASSFKTGSLSAGKFDSWWYRQRFEYSMRQAQRARDELLKLSLNKKTLSGSAFVTFYRADAVTKLMSQDTPRCWELRGKRSGFSYFTFGRPPFASVTLKCMPAPHPDDLNWNNLHVTWKRVSVRFGTLTGLLLIVMVGLITPENLQALVLPLLGESFGLFGWSGDRETNKEMNVHRFKTTLLLGINSLLLPELIYRIAVAARYKQKSVEEIRQMQLNFYFLIINTVVLPILGKDSLKEILIHTAALCGSLLRFESRELPHLLQDFCTGFLNTRGFFVIQYLMSSAMLSNSIAFMAMHWTKLLKMLLLKIYAVSDRERDLCREPAVFAWGYWYAWTLSVVALGLSMSSIIPGTLPVATLFFTLKGFVDRYNLNRGVWVLDSENHGIFTIYVVYYMRVIVAAWWMLMGSACLSVRGTDCPLWPGVLLIVFSFFLFFMSWLRAALMTTQVVPRQNRDIFRRLAEAMGLSPDGNVEVRRSVGNSSVSPCSWDVMCNRNVIWPDALVEQRLQKSRESRGSLFSGTLSLQIHQAFPNAYTLNTLPRMIEMAQVKTAPKIRVSCVDEGDADDSANEVAADADPGTASWQTTWSRASYFEDTEQPGFTTQNGTS